MGPWESVGVWPSCTRSSCTVLDGMKNSKVHGLAKGFRGIEQRNHDVVSESIPGFSTSFDFHHTFLWQMIQNWWWGPKLRPCILAPSIINAIYLLADKKSILRSLPGVAYEKDLSNFTELSGLKRLEPNLQPKKSLEDVKGLQDVTCFGSMSHGPLLSGQKRKAWKTKFTIKTNGDLVVYCGIQKVMLQHCLLSRSRCGWAYLTLWNIGLLFWLRKPLHG